MITREQVIEQSRLYGCDVENWKPEFIDYLVDLCNRPVEFPKVPLQFTEPAFPVDWMVHRYPFFCRNPFYSIEEKATSFR